MLRLNQRERELQLHDQKTPIIRPNFFRIERSRPHPVLVTSPGDDLTTVRERPVNYKDETSGLLRSLRFFDAFAFTASLLVAALAFLLPVYTATNFGTWDQYVGVFAAGFLSKVAIDQGLAPLRSTRLGKSAKKAVAPDPAKA